MLSSVQYGDGGDLFDHAHMWLSSDEKTANFCDAEWMDFAQMTADENDGGRATITIISDKEVVVLPFNSDPVFAMCRMIHDAGRMVNSMSLEPCKVVENPNNPKLNDFVHEAVATYDRRFNTYFKEQNPEGRKEKCSRIIGDINVGY